MEAAEKNMIDNPMDQKALDRLLQAQATYEAVGGLTQDRLVAQVIYGTLDGIRDAAPIALHRCRPLAIGLVRNGRHVISVAC